MSCLILGIEGSFTGRRDTSILAKNKLVNSCGSCHHSFMNPDGQKYLEEGLWPYSCDYDHIHVTIFLILRLNFIDDYILPANHISMITMTKLNVEDSIHDEKIVKKHLDQNIKIVWNNIVMKGNSFERCARKVEYNLTCKKSLTALNTTGSVARKNLSRWHSKHLKICGRYHIWMASAAFEFLTQVTTIFKHGAQRHALDNVSRPIWTSKTKNQKAF